MSSAETVTRRPAAAPADSKPSALTAAVVAARLLARPLPPVKHKREAGVKENICLHSQKQASKQAQGWCTVSRLCPPPRLQASPHSPHPMAPKCKPIIVNQSTTQTWCLLLCCSGTLCTCPRGRAIWAILILTAWGIICTLRPCPACPTPATLAPTCSPEAKSEQRRVEKSTQD